MSIVFFSLLGQISLNSFSHPNESPRAALYRLTSIDIAPNDTMNMVDDQNCALQHISHPPSHNHHGNDCPLCPLLSHILFAVSFSLVWLGYCCLRYFSWKFSNPSRAPPCLFRICPPSRAPPLVI